MLWELIRGLSKCTTCICCSIRFTLPFFRLHGLPLYHYAPYTRVVPFFYLFQLFSFSFNYESSSSFLTLNMKIISYFIYVYVICIFLIVFYFCDFFPCDFFSCDFSVTLLYPRHLCPRAYSFRFSIHPFVY